MTDREIDKLSGAERSAAIERALFRSALGGNFRAQAFWLINRSPDRWSKIRGARFMPRMPSLTLASLMSGESPRDCEPPRDARDRALLELAAELGFDLGPAPRPPDRDPPRRSRRKRRRKSHRKNRRKPRVKTRVKSRRSKPRRSMKRRIRYLRISRCRYSARVRRRDRPRARSPSPV